MTKEDMKQVHCEEIETTGDPHTDARNAAEALLKTGNLMCNDLGLCGMCFRMEMTAMCLSTAASDAGVHGDDWDKLKGHIGEVIKIVMNGGAHRKH